MKNKMLRVTMALGLVLIGLGISIAGAKGGIASPAVGSSLSIKQLFSLINTNNAAKTSQFLMLAPNNGKIAMTVDDYKKCTDFSKMGSVSPLHATDAKNKALSMLNFTAASADAASGTFVLQKATDAHLKAVLSKFGTKLTAAEKAELAKTMLWFAYTPVAGGPAYALFIFDPWCSTLSTALSKWN